MGEEEEEVHKMWELLEMEHMVVEMVVKMQLVQMLHRILGEEEEEVELLITEVPEQLVLL
jgi:hypothetical protein